MKYVVKILIVLLVAATCAGQTSREVLEVPDASASGWTIWGLSGDGADHAISARLGRQGGKVEGGAVLKTYDVKQEHGLSLDAAGVYAALHINEFVSFDDPSPDSGWEQLLHGLLGRPYIGAEIVTPVSGSNWHREPEINFFGGTLLSFDPKFRWSLVIEYMQGQGLMGQGVDEQIVSFGARLLF